MVERFDAVVIGSGAGGGPVALTLARAGARVLVLEKGPELSPKDVVHDEISSCRRDMFVPFPHRDPHTLRRSANAVAQPTSAGWISQCVGGGTVHMSGFFFRFLPEDFEPVRRYGKLPGTTSIDWPFGYETLEPYYARVESEVGVSGDATPRPFSPPRESPYPYPPVETHPLAEHIDATGRQLGMHPQPVPRAIITRPEGERGACVYCPLCGSYGCEAAAKSSTAVSVLAKARATGRCEVRPGCMVFEIPISRSGRALGARYFDAEGRPQTVEASVVVVAAGAIESARLLLMSRSHRFPEGLGNAHGQVGRNLCFSTLTQLETFLERDRLPEALAGGLEGGSPFVGRAVRDFAHTEEGRGGLFHLLWAHPNPIFAAEKLLRDGERVVWGSELMERLAHRFRDGRMLEVEGFSEWLPTPGTRVDLDPKARDAWGLPAARITLDRHPEDARASARVLAKAKRLTEAMGGRASGVPTVGGETWVLQHGTCRMSQRAQDGVTDPGGRLHGVSNVFVSDGGALPSSGAAPSTQTIMANAFRVAESVVSAL